MSMPFRGVYANLPTALDDDGENLSPTRQKAIVRYVLENGVHGIACLLSSGEFPYLSPDERRGVVDAVLEEVNGRVPVVVGVSAFTTAEAVTFAKHAAGSGASAVMLLPMQYLSLTDDEVVSYFSGVAQAIDIPTGMYENTAFNAPLFSADLYARLANEANLRVSKNGTDSIFHIADINYATDDRVSVLDGSHGRMLAALAIGAAGLCTSFASVWPRACVELYQYTQDNNFDEARQCAARIFPAMKFYHDHSLVRCVKESAEMVGYPMGPHRSPVSNLPPADLATLRKIVEQTRFAPVRESVSLDSSDRP